MMWVWNPGSDLVALQPENIDHVCLHARSLRMLGLFSVQLMPRVRAATGTVRRSYSTHQGGSLQIDDADMS